MANQISFMGSLFISIYTMYACNTHIILHVSYCFILLIKDGVSQSLSSLDSFSLIASLSGSSLGRLCSPGDIGQHLETCLVDIQGVEWVLVVGRS